LFEGMPGGNECAAAFASFDQYYSQAQAADEAIAGREHAGLGRRLQRSFTDQAAPVGNDPASQVLMFWGIDASQATG
jgi:hypothetical protein